MSKEELESITQAVSEIQTAIEDIQTRLVVLKQRSEDLVSEMNEAPDCMLIHDLISEEVPPNDNV